MKILIARDEAFNFTYRANIDWLRKVGEVQFFSPMGSTPSPSLLRRGVECTEDEWLDNDSVIKSLKEAVQLSPLPSEAKWEGQGEGLASLLLYLPGGYPELFAKELEANVNMRCAIKRFAEEGGHIFAECGGFMYLCKRIDDSEMCGVLPLDATMDGARLHLGYRQMEWNGKLIKGHEFHYSSILGIDASMPTWEKESQSMLTGEDEKVGDELCIMRLQRTASGKPVDTPIYRYRNVVAGYTHWYWADKKIEDFINLCSNNSLWHR